MIEKPVEQEAEELLSKLEHEALSWRRPDERSIETRRRRQTELIAAAIRAERSRAECTECERRKALEALSAEDEAEFRRIQEMPIEDVNKELKAEGIDVDRITRSVTHLLRLHREKAALQDELEAVKKELAVSKQDSEDNYESGIKKGAGLATRELLARIRELEAIGKKLMHGGGHYLGDEGSPCGICCDEAKAILQGEKS